MTGTPVPSLEARIDIAAPPAVVWSVLGDVTRMADWSPQVTSTRVKESEGGYGVGTRFTNRNVHGELEWTTHAEITAFEPERELAFRVEENHVVWSFRLEPVDDGTLVTQRRDAPDGISDLSRDFSEKLLGGVEAFSASMHAGMHETLERLKADVEAGPSQ